MPFPEERLFSELFGPNIARRCGGEWEEEIISLDFRMWDGETGGGRAKMMLEEPLTKQLSEPGRRKNIRRGSQRV
jgi:hypothetical protein